MRVYVLSQDLGSMAVICQNMDGVAAEIETSNNGDEWYIEVHEMPEEEFARLPDFDGW
jgi:hypothetical protein